MEELTKEQAGELILTIGRFHRGEDISIDDPILKGVWLGIKHDFVKQKEKYEATCERNRINGKKGGRPKTQDNPNNPSGFSLTHSNPKNLKEKEKEKEKYKKKVIPSSNSLEASKYKVDNFKHTPEYKDKLSIQMAKQFDELFKDI
jgi:hypothetical protein